MRKLASQWTSVLFDVSALSFSVVVLEHVYKWVLSVVQLSTDSPRTQALWWLEIALHMRRDLGAEVTEQVMFTSSSSLLLYNVTSSQRLKLSELSFMRIPWLKCFTMQKTRYKLNQTNAKIFNHPYQKCTIFTVLHFDCIVNFVHQ